jgi:ubiquinone/menaquinone biosynthesis C-methylase UbiE
MPDPTFTALERDGWDRNAAAYADVILAWTSQAFAPLLDSLGDLRGRRLLDVASGTGHLVKAAADRGAIAEGVDIAPEMAARAGRSFLGLTFRVGNADALPYDDGSFDAVTCCFGLLHMERPEEAIAEACRVLRPGGRFGYTVWHGPTSGGTLVGILLKTFQRLGTMEVGLPPAPPMFQFAEAETRDRVLAAAGFTAIAGRDLDIRWRATAPEAIGRLLKDGMVRTRLIFERQTPAVQESILAAVIAEARAFATPAGVEIPNAAHLATAVKPE